MGQNTIWTKSVGAGQRVELACSVKGLELTCVVRAKNFDLNACGSKFLVDALQVKVCCSMGLVSPSGKEFKLEVYKTPMPDGVKKEEFVGKFVDFVNKITEIAVLNKERDAQEYLFTNDQGKKTYRINDLSLVKDLKLDDNLYVLAEEITDQVINLVKKSNKTYVGKDKNKKPIYDEKVYFTHCINPKFKFLLDLKNVFYCKAGYVYLPKVTHDAGYGKGVCKIWAWDKPVVKAHPKFERPIKSVVSGYDDSCYNVNHAKVNYEAEKLEASLKK